jgi:valyl-tRNA synthetase
MMNTEQLDEGPIEPSPADLWIRSRFDHAVRSVHENFAAYRLDLAAQAIYEFTWHEFCDWYLELSKPVLQSDVSSAAQKRAARRTLIEILESLLRLLHPLMPFITEEIWLDVSQRAGCTGDTIMLQRFPMPAPDARDESAERELGWVMQFILGVRQIRGEMDISPGKQLPVVLQNASTDDRRRAVDYMYVLQRVARIESIRVLEDGESPPASATALLGDMRLLVPMKGLIDVDAERQRLRKLEERARADLGRSRAKLDNPRFVDNAPPEVVQQERDRISDFERQLAQLGEQLEKLDRMA